jgi:hypothetical protein
VYTPVLSAIWQSDWSSADIAVAREDAARFRIKIQNEAELVARQQAGDQDEASISENKQRAIDSFKLVSSCGYAVTDQLIII